MNKRNLILGLSVAFVSVVGFFAGKASEKRVTATVYFKTTGVGGTCKQISINNGFTLAGAGSGSVFVTEAGNTIPASAFYSNAACTNSISSSVLRIAM